ncbi:MAG TPA: FKBP-type peptidyl-prolyl cis-trans isomerase [Prolixibacteraceae bacterium]|nr:FKBP-type peptidyl-prolyl cis-trans isomerase [Prolixibacteraceae bacterium]
MQIAENKMVTLSYTLRADDRNGDIIEQTTHESPLRFVYGMGAMLPSFESNLNGLLQGDPFEMTLKASDAYGEFDESSIVDLPRNIFMIDGVFDEERFKPGAQIPMQTQSGQRLNGVVIEVNDENLKMDFNHPLAGVDLHFEGTILEVRNATDDEIASYLGCGSGCNSGCSSDSCCSGGCGC